ncbi:polysaccharide biosynthesis family protein [Carnobacterium maltaromaticum]|uniref:lipopolysaccharide biosynthesis protein n=1 Tax=Carnobacterium maltaromaticum TaxID=2751 RepID=UPI00295F0532|nr:polysaccharide biosynthesis family protein [Carnobacterium maltaromaticum]
MKSQKSAINITVGILAQIIIVLLGFVTRKVFIDYLGNDANGLNNYFTNIVAMLSLVELGLGNSLLFSLYKPLAEKNHDLINRLLSVYKKIYYWIIAIIGFLGIILASFMPTLIGSDSGFSNSYIIAVFSLFILSTMTTYLFTYKRLLLTANQDGYYASLADIIYSIIRALLQIFIIMKTQNFILFLVVDIFLRLIENYVLSLFIQKKYAYLKTLKNSRLEPALKETIIDNTKSLAFHRIGTFIMTGLDSILINAFYNLGTVSIFSNYTLISSTLLNLVTQFSTGISASFGLLLAEGKLKRLFETYRMANFINFMIVNFSAVTLLALFNPFMQLWLGDKFLFDNSIVFILVLNFTIASLTTINGSIRGAAGLFKPDKYLHIFYALLKIAFSLLLNQYLGLIGIFLATTICYLIKDLIVLPIIVYRGIFKKSARVFYQEFFGYGSVILVSGLLISLTKQFIYSWSLAPFSAFLCLALMCLIIPNLLAISVYHRSQKYKDSKELIFSTLFKKKS